MKDVVILGSVGIVRYLEIFLHECESVDDGRIGYGLPIAEFHLLPYDLDNYIGRIQVTDNVFQ